MNRKCLDSEGKSYLKPLIIGSHNIFRNGSIADTANIGDGNELQARCRLSKGCSLGNGCIVSMSAVVDRNQHVPDKTCVSKFGEAPNHGFNLEVHKATIAKFCQYLRNSIGPSCEKPPVPKTSSSRPGVLATPRGGTIVLPSPRTHEGSQLMTPRSHNEFLMTPRNPNLPGRPTGFKIPPTFPKENSGNSEKP